MNVDSSHNARQALRAHGLRAQLERTLKTRGYVYWCKSIPIVAHLRETNAAFEFSPEKDRSGVITDYPLQYKNAGTAVIV